MRIKFLLIFTILLNISLFSQSYDISKIESEIFRIVNEERKKMNIHPLKYDEKLANMARIHSENMVKYNFFSHKGKDGSSPQKRKEIYYPELMGGVGENIAYNFGSSEEEIAKRLMASWMSSTGHRENILSRKYSHIGVGVAVDSRGYIYATQNFSDSQAIFLDKLPVECQYDDTITLKFKFIGLFPKDKLTIFLHYADRRIRFYTKDNRYYTGVEPLIPKWEDDDIFLLEIKCNKGRGIYQITMGSYGSYYPEGLCFTVK